MFAMNSSLNLGVFKTNWKKLETQMFLQKILQTADVTSIYC